MSRICCWCAPLRGAGDRSAASRGREPRARDPATAHRKRSALVAGGALGVLVALGRIRFLTMLMTSRHMRIATRRPQLACAGPDRGAGASHWPDLRSDSRAAIDQDGPGFGAERSPREPAAAAQTLPSASSQSEPDSGRGADCDLATDAGCGGPVCAHAVESAIGESGFQSRERAAV